MQSFRHVHVLGVCGTLMGAFASYLKRDGVRVTGSDQNVYPPMSDVLQKAGVELFSPYSAENLNKIESATGKKPDLFVIGNVISKGNVEMSAIEASGVPYVSLPEFMENHLLPKTRNLVVAGTHGKTTTSSLLAHVLSEAGLNPSYFIGGVSHSLPHSFHVPRDSSYFVLEGDEYDTAFWDKVPKFNHYLPNDVILTSVEFDHADIYADLNAVKRAFRGLLTRIRNPGRLIACIETENVRELLKEFQGETITYSRNPSDRADFTFRNLITDGVRTSFDLVEQGVALDRIEISLCGEHNVLNALAVYIECRKLGIDSKIIAQGLRSFKGIKRRQEERGEVRGVLVIDDFAHHPTAVRETLNALKLRYPDRRLIAVFEPRSATSRRKVFQKDYTEAFDQASAVFVAQAFDQNKIPLEQQFSSQELVQGIDQRGIHAVCFKDVDEGVKLVADHTRQGDLVAVLSNGGFGGFIPKVLEQLAAH